MQNITPDNIQVDPMLPVDVSRVMEIQIECYTMIPPESEQSVRAKLDAASDFCFVARVNGVIEGYLQALPCRENALPVFDDPECTLPAEPELLYLHDLAVSLQGRKKGFGILLVSRFFKLCEHLKYPKASLISVQRSAPYWSRYGFEIVTPTVELAKKLESYGSDAKYMEIIFPSGRMVDRLR